jgi:hypothetical protein
MQKKVLLTLTIIVLGLASQAQVEKGDWLLGGSMGFSSSSNTVGNATSTSSNSNVNPELGLAIGKNSVLGLRGGFDYYPAKDAAGYNQSSYTYSAGGFWKMLFPINEKVGWFTDLELSYLYGSYKYTSGTSQITKNTNSGFYGSASPGIYYKPAKKILLNAGLGGFTYTRTRTHASGSDIFTNSNFNFSLLNYFSFGIDFIISKDHQM